MMIGKMRNWCCHIVCLVVGHRWYRFGYPTSDKQDGRRDDNQLFVCMRCHYMPIVGHNGALPRLGSKK